MMRAIILIVLVVMSLAAGGAKLLQMQQEVQFFNEAGLGTVPLILLGLIQMVGGGAAILSKSRIPGICLIALGFLLSSIVILMTGNTGFAFGSLVPVALAIGLFLSVRRVAI